MRNNDLLAWIKSKGMGPAPTQAPAFGGIANPRQRAKLRGSDQDYLEARQKELDAYEEQRLAYNTGLTKYQDEVYKPYQAQAEAYNTAAQKYNTEVYNPYQTQYEAYEKAITDYNAGPRTTDYAGPAEPTLASKFEMTAPTAPDVFSMTSPVLPFKVEDVEAYQKQAAQTAQSDAENRGVAIDVVSDPSKYNFGSMSVTNRFMAEGGSVDAAPSGQARSMIDQMTGMVASAGRGGDTQLAHLSPQSAALLKSQGGAGTINPKTGLPEYLAVIKPAEIYDEAAKTNFKGPDGRPLDGFEIAAQYIRGDYTPGYLEGLAAAEEARKRAVADAAAATLAESQRRAEQNAAAEKAIAERIAREKEAEKAAVLAKEKEAERIYASRVRDQRVAGPVAGTVASTVRPIVADYSFNTRASTPLKAVDLGYIKTPTTPIGSRGPVYTSPNFSQQPEEDDSEGMVTLPNFINNNLGSIPIALPTMGTQNSPMTDPKNFFALDPSRPPSIPGLLPGTVALAPLDLPLAAGRKTLEAIAANPNLSPKMLGGRENAGIMTDRLGNKIYSPGAKPLLYRSGGEVSKDLAALMAQNTENLSDEQPEDTINTNPVGTAQKFLADLNNAGKASPTRQSVKRVRTSAGGGATADKAMQLAYEDLAKGDLGTMKDRAPAVKNTESARSQMEELARVYQLKIRAAQNAAKGLSADIFGAPTLEGPTLTKGKLTKKRFKKGGEAKKSDAESAKEPGIFSVDSYATETSARMFPDQEGQDDERDAARHMLAAAVMSKKMGPGMAAFLGKAYERTSNPESFFSMLGIGKPREDYEMDVHNNKVGAELAARSTSQADLEKLVQAIAMKSQNKQVEGKSWTMSDEQKKNRKPQITTQPPEYRSEGSPVEGERAPKLTGVNRVVDAIAQRLPADSFPTAARTLLETIQGKKEPITESNFSPKELVVLRQLIESTGGRGDVQYKDYLNLMKKEQQEKGTIPMSINPSPLSVLDPIGNVQTTLGRFTYSRDANGNLVVVDKYDFNPVPSFSGAYGAIRNYAGEKIPRGSGREVKINLGKPVAKNPIRTKNGN